MTPQQVIKLTVSVVLEHHEDGVIAYAPAFKGLCIGEENEEKALNVIGKGIIKYLESMRIHGEPIPLGPDLTVEKFSVPDKAQSKNVDILWPIPRTSGASLRA